MKNIFRLIVGVLMVVSTIICFFNADLGATLCVYIIFIMKMMMIGKNIRFMLLTYGHPME
jgi:hypothetical protein